MVYCGKPSKGCSNCRERKIRCDLREPGCGQCDKRQQQCPGYRNMVDLMFRDESSHVIKKAKAKARKKVSAPASAGPGAGTSPDSASPTESISGASRSTPVPTSATSPAPPSPFSSCSRSPQQSQRHGKRTLSLLTPASRPTDTSLQLNWSNPDEPLLPSPDAGSWPKTPMIALGYTLNPTCQEQGTAYFFSRYVSIDENACHQRFDFIYDIWKPGSLVPEHQVDSVMASMTAVGLAGLANLKNSMEVMECARKSYGTALTLINAALRDTEEARKDTTMLSILILGLFEMVAVDASPETMRGWQKHVNGAAVLAGMRGVDQFRTRAGTRMFMMLCQSVMISCIQQEVPMPQSLIDLRGEMVARRERIDSPTSSIEVSMPIYRVLQFRHDVKSGRFESREAMIDRLIEMEAEFQHVTSDLPPAWGYRTFRVAKPHKGVFGDLCHVYPTTAKAAVWNGIRACRLLILETLLAELHTCFVGVNPSLVAPRYIEAFSRAKAGLDELCRAILASVPQHSGLIGPGDGSGDSSSTPIMTVEIRAPATPPQSPESTTSVSSSSSSSSSSDFAEDHQGGGIAGWIVDDTGPTLLDPTRGRDDEEVAQRFMLLASASNTIVWPLYHVGMASTCSAAMKAYCVDRLEAIYKETALRQAGAIASIMQNRQVIPRWRELAFPEIGRGAGTGHACARLQGCRAI